MGSKASLIYQLQPGRPEKDELAPGACSGEEGAWEQPCHGRGGRLSPPDPASLWEDEARSCRIALCKSRYFVISPGRLGQEDAPVWRGGHPGYRPAPLPPTPAALALVGGAGELGGVTASGRPGTMLQSLTCVQVLVLPEGQGPSHIPSPRWASWH